MGLSAIYPNYKLDPNQTIVKTKKAATFF